MVDVQIVAATSGNFPLSPRQGPFMTSPDVGYWFYVDGGPPSLFYKKTVDRGATWSAPVQVSTQTYNQIWGFSVWPGWFTPGQTANTKIYCVWGGEATDEIAHRYLDTSDDTFGSVVQIVAPALAAVPGVSWNNHMMDITLSRAKAGIPQLMVQWHHKPTTTLTRNGHVSVDDGASWSNIAVLAESPMGPADASDRYLIFPGNEADEYDMVALYWDEDIAVGGKDLSWKTYDDSLDTWTEQVVFDPGENLDQNGLALNMAGMVDHSNGWIRICYRDHISGDNDVATASWRSIALGNLFGPDVYSLETGFHDGCGLHIDQITGDIYVNWNGAAGETSGATNHYYAVSTDGFVSFGSPIQYNEDAATRKVEGWGFGSTHPTNGGRLIFSWDVTFVPGTTNFNNSFPLADPTITTISPAIGPTAGGQTVTIVGTALDGLQGVSFGGVGATIVSSTAVQIVAETPPGAVGFVDVVVLTDYGVVTLSNGYQYILVTNPVVAGVGAGGSGREFTSYISPDGVVYDLNTPHHIGRFIVSQSGWGTPPIDYVTQRGPFQHGVTVRDFFLQPRVVQLLIRNNYCDRDGWWAGRAELLNEIRPNRQTTATATEPGQLRRVKSSGEVRDLDVFIAEGPRFEPRVAGTWDEWSFQEVLRFVAHNPIEFDPTEVVATFTITLPTSLVFPITFPITFGGTITETLLVDYIGTWESLPRIIITGPIDNPEIENTTTGEKLEFAFDVPAGRELEIDLAYGVKTVLEGPTGGPYTINRIGTLSSDSDLATFHLAPTPEAPQVAGQPAPTARNTITLTGRGVSGGTAVAVRYFTRFFGI